MSATDRRELERLLDPISPGAFFDEHWEKKPLHIPGPPAKLEHVRFGRREFWETVAALPEDAKCLRAIYDDASGKHNELLDVEPRIARSLFDSGMTLVFTFLEDRCETIRDLVRRLRASLDLPGKITVGCFFSPEDHGAGLHYDSHSALVLQLEGRKRWQVSRRPALAYPPRNYGYESDAAIAERNARAPHLATEPPVPADFLEVELSPGHVFYMPPGTWHRPRATGEGGSLALTLGPFVRTPLELVTEQLARGLGERLEWRRSVPVGPASPSPRGGLPGEVERFFEARLAELRAHVESLTPADLGRLWHAQIAPPPVLSAERLASGRRPVSPDERIRRDGERRASWTRAKDSSGEAKVFLYVDGEEIDLPAFAFAFVETLLTRSDFLAGEACAWVSQGEEPWEWEDVKHLLEVLLTRGFLHR